MTANIFNHLETRNTSEMPAYNADGSAMGIDGKDGFKQTVFHLLSRTSDEIRKLNLEQERQNIEAAKRNRNKTVERTPEEIRELGYQRLIAIIAGWDNMPDGKGGEIKYSHDIAQQLARNPKMDYLHSQIFNYHNDDGNFTKA